MSRCRAIGHTWDAAPVAWYRYHGGWVAAYRCHFCQAIDPRPCAGPGQLPQEAPVCPPST